MPLLATLLLPVQRGHITYRRIKLYRHTHYMQIGPTICVYASCSHAHAADSSHIHITHIPTILYNINPKMLYVCINRSWKTRSNSGQPSISLFSLLGNSVHFGLSAERLLFFVFHVMEHDVKKHRSNFIIRYV